MRRNALFHAAHRMKSEAIVAKYKSERNEVVRLLQANKTKYLTIYTERFWKAVQLVKRQESSNPCSEGWVNYNYFKHCMVKHSYLINSSTIVLMIFWSANKPYPPWHL